MPRNAQNRDSGDYHRFTPTQLAGRSSGGGGPPQRDRQLVELRVPARAREALTAGAIALAAQFAGDIETQPGVMAAMGAQLLQKHLPSTMIARLRSLGRPSNTTVVVLRGLADLPAPVTPVHGVANDSDLTPQDILLAGALRLAGTTPMSFPFENGGRIARNVVANPKQTGMASSHGFDVELFWHQDNCGQPFEGETALVSDLPAMPYQLGFFAMRNAELVPTRILLVDDVVTGFSDGALDALAQPAFRIGPPDSVVADSGGDEAIENAPVLRREGGFWECRFDPFLVMPNTAHAAAANARLILALAESRPRAVDIVLDAGDVMVFKNYRMLHMRVAFTPLAADESRWLRRFYGARRVVDDTNVA